MSADSNTGRKHGEKIFDLLADGEPRTRKEIQSALGFNSRATFTNAVSFIRHALADSHELNLVVTRHGDGRHRYYLAKNMDEAAPWLKDRNKSVRGQLKTMRMVASTFPEREGRIVARGFERMLEDLADLEEIS